MVKMAVFNRVFDAEKTSLATFAGGQTLGVY